jgi:hypothetical protein
MRQRGREEAMCFKKKGLEERLHIGKPPCTCTMANCVHTAGGQWALKREEEGGRAKRGEKQAGQALLGDTGGVPHPHPRSRSLTPAPPPPPALHRCVD